MQHTRTFNRVTVGTHENLNGRSRSAAKTSPYLRLAKKIFRRVKVQLALYIALFFIAPAVLPDGANTVMLTLVYPTFAFLLSSIYGYKYGFIKHYLAIPFMLFVIASFFHFEAFSFLYGLCYLLVSIIALAFGTIYRQLCR